jgi:hypothetical protein
MFILRPEPGPSHCAKYKKDLYTSFSTCSYCLRHCPVCKTGLVGCEGEQHQQA